MHKFYVFKNARVKKGEKIMFTEKDLRCDGSELKLKPMPSKVNIDEVLFDDEVDQLIQSRSNDTYNEIADDAGDIISILEDDIRFNYFFAQIANKLARIKHRYSVEDSLLDIAGYAKLELERLRNEKDQ